MLYTSTHKSAQSASACDASQFHSPASRQSPESALPRLLPDPHHRARGAVWDRGSASLVHAWPEEPPATVLTGRWHSQHAFLARDHSTPFSGSDYQGRESPLRDFSRGPGAVTMQTENIAALAAAICADTGAGFIRQKGLN